MPRPPASRLRGRGSRYPPPWSPRVCPGIWLALRPRSPPRASSLQAPPRPASGRPSLPARPEKALPGGGGGSSVRAMVALENPEGGSEAAAVGSAPGGRRTL